MSFLSWANQNPFNAFASILVIAFIFYFINQAFRSERNMIVNFIKTAILWMIRDGNFFKLLSFLFTCSQEWKRIRGIASYHGVELPDLKTVAVIGAAHVLDDVSKTVPEKAAKEIEKKVNDSKNNIQMTLGDKLQLATLNINDVSVTGGFEDGKLKFQTGFKL